MWLFTNDSWIIRRSIWDPRDGVTYITPFFFEQGISTVRVERGVRSLGNGSSSFFSKSVIHKSQRFIDRKRSQKGMDGTLLYRVD